MHDLSEIQALVHAYRDFAECVVESIEWSDRGTSVSITFDYIWKPDGSVRADDERSEQYDGFSTPIHHASLRRESGAWIDIVFGELDVTEASASSDMIR